MIDRARVAKPLGICGQRVLFLEPSVDRLASIGIHWAQAVKDALPGVRRFVYDELYRRRGRRELQKELERCIDEHDTAVVFMPDVNYEYSIQFDPHFLNRLRSKVYLAGFFPDVYLYYDYFYRYYAQLFDLVMVDSYYDKFRFLQYGIDTVYLPYAYDPSRYRPADGQAVCDVSFVGTAAKGRRAEYLAFLSGRGVDVQRYGINSPNGPLDHQAMVRLFGTSRINLNFSGIDDFTVERSGYSINGHFRQLKGRVSEVLLSGGFLLTEYDPSLERLFRVGPEGDLDFFRDENELLSKVRFYLSDDRLRQRMAANGRGRALELFDSGKTAAGLLGLIAGALENRAVKDTRFFSATAYRQFIAAIRVYWLLRHAARLRFARAWEELLRILSDGGFNLLRVWSVFSFYSVRLRRLLVRMQARRRG